MQYDFQSLIIWAVARGDALRKLAAGSQDKNWFYGQFRACQYVAEAAILHKENVDGLLSQIRDELGKVKKEEFLEGLGPDQIRRVKGCVRQFEETISYIRQSLNDAAG